MTWGEFKKWAEESGVVDENEIRFIDFNGRPCESGVSFDDDGEISIM